MFMCTYGYACKLAHLHILGPVIYFFSFTECLIVDQSNGDFVCNMCIWKTIGSSEFYVWKSVCGMRVCAAVTVQSNLLLIEFGFVVSTFPCVHDANSTAGSLD